VKSFLAAQAFPSIPTDFSAAWSVCLFVVYHIRAPW